MISMLAEAAWTPSLVVGGLVSGAMLLAKLFPWLKGSAKNGNGNGETRGETRRALADISEDIRRHDEENKNQWDGINQNRADIASIKSTIEGIDATVREVRSDIKRLVTRDHSGGKDDE